MQSSTSNRGSEYQVSEKSYLLSDISRTGFKLPLPCVVQDGYYGASSWDTVSSGETIFLCSLDRRPRVLAYDEHHRYYSIPLDYPLEFSMVHTNGKVSAPKLISDILKNHDLPVTLQIDQKNMTLHSSNDLKRVLHLGNVVVKRKYDEKYFVGSSIVSGVLQNELIMIPTFLKIRVQLIDGMVGMPAATWAPILDAWKADAEQYTTNSPLPPIDIVMFQSLPPEADPEIMTSSSSQPDEIYETLEPTTYVKLNYKLSFRKSNVYTSLSEFSNTTGDYSPPLSSVPERKPSYKSSAPDKPGVPRLSVPKPSVPKPGVPDKSDTPDKSSIPEKSDNPGKPSIPNKSDNPVKSSVRGFPGVLKPKPVVKLKISNDYQENLESQFAKSGLQSELKQTLTRRNNSVKQPDSVADARQEQSSKPPVGQRQKPAPPEPKRKPVEDKPPTNPLPSPTPALKPGDHMRNRRPPPPPTPDQTLSLKLTEEKPFRRPPPIPKSDVSSRSPPPSPTPDPTVVSNPTEDESSWHTPQPQTPGCNPYDNPSRPVATTPVQDPTSSLPQRQGSLPRRPLPPPSPNQASLSRHSSFDVTTTPSSHSESVQEPSLSSALTSSHSEPHLDADPEPDYDEDVPHSHTGKIRSWKDVPSKIERLNCEQVGDCLRLLRMNKYIDSFLANQVDGTLLTQLDESILSRELQMTSLHARKLMMFVKQGWRPDT